MRAAFSLAILCLAIFYTYTAFGDMSFLSSTGRLGPAFFPRIIGVTLVAACLYNLAMELRRSRDRVEEHGDWRVTAAVAALSALFILLLEVLGGVAAMIVFLLAALSYLNRGKWLQNVAISLVLPLAIYFLFDVWLNASFPDGLIPLPI